MVTRTAAGTLLRRKQHGIAQFCGESEPEIELHDPASILHARRDWATLAIMKRIHPRVLCACLGLGLASFAAQAPDRKPAPRGESAKPSTVGEELLPLQPEAAPETFETVRRKLTDGIEMTADLYRVKDAPKNTPLLVCFHKTASSRGEYRRLAPDMMSRGFDVLAVDLRCGGAGENSNRRTGERFGVRNETWAAAKAKLGREPTYAEAYPDMERAVEWARELAPGSKIGLVGSSYSASLVLIYAAEHPEKVDAVLSYSPGEYIDGWQVGQRAKNLRVPTLITCGNTDADTTQAKPIAATIAKQTGSKLTEYWPEDEGFVGDHGVRALMIRDPKSREKQWQVFDAAVAPLVLRTK